MDRLERVNAHIQREISTLITRIVSFKKGVIVTVSDVKTDRDLRNARIFVSVLPEEEGHYVLQTLAHEHGAIQKALHKKLFMRTPPKISFHHDTRVARADDLNKILQDL